MHHVSTSSENEILHFFEPPQLKHSRDNLFYQVLGKPVVLRAWNLQGLPSDKTSVESAIAATTVGTGKWPLLIDPQRRACRWLKQKGT